MCNEIRRRVALGDITEVFSHLRIPLRFPEGLPNLAPLDSIRITDKNVMVRAGADGPELLVRRWSWPMPNGKPLYNFKSEGRDLSHGRCLIVADGFYEFTKPDDTKAKRKHKWLFTWGQEAPFCIAGLWRDSPTGEAFTLLTGPPGPDVASYHHRQICVLPPDRWAAWLDPAVPSADLLQPLPAGTLHVRRIA